MQIKYGGNSDSALSVKSVLDRASFLYLQNFYSLVVYIIFNTYVMMSYGVFSCQVMVQQSRSLLNNYP